ncbi:MAG: erythromycin esterase family protein, partial [bacterium]
LDLGFTVWNTNEMLDLIEWLGSYNASVPADQAVGFWGFDMQDPQAAIHQVVTYVTEVLPSEADALAGEYRCFELLGGTGYGGVPEPTKEQCRTGVDAAAAWIDANRDLLVDASSVEAYEWAARNAMLVVQAEELGAASDADSANQLRDRFMAENATWLLDQAGADAKFILWSHNGHVARSVREGGHQPMGVYLGDILSDGLVVIGFEFSRGSLTSMTATSEGLGTEVVTVPPPPPDSYAGAFASTGLGRFILDLRQLPNDLAGRWLLDEHPVRWIGAVYDPLNDADTIELVRMPQMFDLVVYLENTTPSNVRATAEP